MRCAFCSCFLRCTRQVNAWLSTLPAAEKTMYRRFLLPSVHPITVQGLTKQYQGTQQSRQTRKQETDAVVIQFSDLRAERHDLYNRIVRLRQAYLAAVKESHPRQAQGSTDI